MSLVEHLEKLRHFHKLAKYKSINEASKLIGISQPGLSKSISSLEDALETVLFLRTPEGLILTKEGELTLKVSGEILEKASSLETQIRSLKASKVPHRLRVGMYDSIAVYFFTQLMTYMREVYNEVEIQLVVDSSAHLIDNIHDDEVDLAIGVNYDKAAKKGLEFFELFEDCYSFYINPALMNEKAQLPLILHPKATDSAGRTTESYLGKVIAQKGAHRTFNFETIKTLTVQGHGIGVLPTQVARPLLETRQLVAITLPKVAHLFGEHKIGFLISQRILNEHREFAEDIYRIGTRWAKG